MQRLQIKAPTKVQNTSLDEIFIGIDLGTTNSLACYYEEEGKPRIVCDISPSVVTFFEDGTFEACNLNHAKEGRGITVSSIKRKMGKEERLEIYGKTYTPEQISAIILTHIKRKSEEALGKPIKGAVITIPAYFDDAQKTATKLAGEMAGLEVLRLLSEPTSASVYFDIENKEEGIYAVYDLGGGTFDASILQMKMGVIKVLAVGGDAELGGDDFDAIVAEKLKCSILEARKIKEEVCTKGAFNGFTIDEFDEMILPLIHTTVNIFESTIIDARVKMQDLKGVILVGGSTKMPIVREAINQEFKTDIFEDVDADRIVALGAGLHAFNIQNRKGNLLLDVVPLTLGIETLNGLVLKVIPRNSLIPIEVETELTTGEDFQTGVIIHIVQGEREFVKDCRSLAQVEINGIPPLPKGMAQIMVKFKLDIDGILSVFARENLSGNEVDVEIRPSYNLETRDIRKMFEEAMKHGKEDMQKRLLEEARLEARSIILTAKLLKRPELEALIAGLEGVCDSGSEEEIKAEIDKIRLKMAHNEY
jgi:molecular chaperone HscA